MQPELGRFDDITKHTHIHGAVHSRAVNLPPPPPTLAYDTACLLQLSPVLLVCTSYHLLADTRRGSTEVCGINVCIPPVMGNQ